MRPSRRREAVLDFIKEYIAENHMPPTRRDIMAGVGLSTTSVVSYQLLLLQREGRIELVDNIARGIRLVDGTVPV